MVLTDTDFLFSLLRNFNKGGSMNNANYEDNQNDWIFTLYFIVFYPYVGSVCFVGFYAYLNLTTTVLVDRIASGDFIKKRVCHSYRQEGVLLCSSGRCVNLFAKNSTRCIRSACCADELLESLEHVELLKESGFIIAEKYSDYMKFYERFSLTIW